MSVGRFGAGSWARRLAMTGLVGFVAIGVGCSESRRLQAFDLTVSLSDEAIARGELVEVDVIAVSDRATLESQNMGLYFTAGSQYRRDLRGDGEVWSVTLTPGASSQTLSARDGRWKTQWKNDPYLFIMAGLPIDQPQSGLDPRREVRPRFVECWDSRALNVTISPARIALDPEKKPDCE